MVGPYGTSKHLKQSDWWLDNWLISWDPAIKGKGNSLVAGSIQINHAQELLYSVASFLLAYLLLTCSKSSGMLCGNKTILWTKRTLEKLCCPHLRQVTKLKRHPERSVAKAESLFELYPSSIAKTRLEANCHWRVITAHFQFDEEIHDVCN